MRRFLSWLIMIPALAAVVVFALHNAGPVALDLWPFSILIEMPVYLALLLALAAGALIGGVSAWLGQGGMRAKLRDASYAHEVAKRQLAEERERAMDLQRELDKRRATQTPSSGANLPATQETLPPAETNIDAAGKSVRPAPTPPLNPGPNPAQNSGPTPPQNAA